MAAEVLTVIYKGEKQRNAVIFDERSFSDLLVEYLGHDARSYFEDLIDGYKNEIKGKSDYAVDLEREADGLWGELHNIADSLYQELERSKLNRNNIERIYNELMANL